jgi:hypothetical protein
MGKRGSADRWHTAQPIRGIEKDTSSREAQWFENASLEFNHRQTGSRLATTSSNTAIRAATPWVT